MRERKQRKFTFAEIGFGTILLAATALDAVKVVQGDVDMNKHIPFLIPLMLAAMFFMWRKATQLTG